MCVQERDTTVYSLVWLYEVCSVQSYHTTKEILMFYLNLSGRKSHGKHTFKMYRSHIWNLLSNEIKLGTEIDKFKSILK